MEKFKNNKNPEEQNSIGDNSLYDIELIDEEPVAGVSKTAESYQQPGQENSAGTSDDEATPEAKPKRKRGRPPKNKTKSPTRATKTKSKTAKKWEVGKSDSQQGKAEASEAPPPYETYPPKKKISASVFNLFLFAVIFAALVAAQFLLKRDDKKVEKVNVSTMEITAEEEIEVAETTSQRVRKTKTDVADETEAEVVTEGPAVAEAEVEEVVENEAGEGKPSEEVVVIEEGLPEEVEAVEVVEAKRVPTQRVSQSWNGEDRSIFYRPDPWTNGSSQDLDGPFARQRYREENRVENKKRAKSRSYHPRFYEQDVYKYERSYTDRDRGVYEKTKVREYKSYSDSDLDAICGSRYGGESRSYTSYRRRDTGYRESYSDRSNPWNSGGITDLDHPANQTQQTVTKRTNRIYDY